MSGYQDYPSAPRVGEAFRSGGANHETPPPSGQDPNDLLDHLDLSSLDYTPGGTIEQQVHQEVSLAGRAAYAKATTSSGEPDHEEHYRQQMEDDFYKRIAELEEEHEAPDRGEGSPGDDRDGNPPEPADMDLSPAELKARIDTHLKSIGPAFGSVSPDRGVGPTR
jgi:hypothetical protein